VEERVKMCKKMIRVISYGSLGLHPLINRDDVGCDVLWSSYWILIHESWSEAYFEYILLFL